MSATTPAELAWYLDGAVRLEIARMAGDGWTAAIRAKVARQARARITALTGGAELLFGGRACTTEYAALATALAALAYQPGGVTALGRHWCTDHTACLDVEAGSNPDEPVNDPDPTYRGRPISTITPIGGVL